LVKSMYGQSYPNRYYAFVMILNLLGNGNMNLSNNITVKTDMWLWESVTCLIT
jgi:hypothetical protein